ncbi:cystine/glutamate transporter-like [Lytechinus pictus]|uniref:cystine/glutamate transporter-like n=1 Tax=Lytechinus pictus TaxID=7653 RepID=UPI0030BA0769
MARSRKASDEANQGTSLKDLTNNNTAVRLTRQVTLLDSISLIVGMIIGSGIFISPISVLENSGGIGWSLLVWALCGIISMLGALSYAELGTTFPVSGGDFSYLLEAYGPIPAFLRLWTSVVSIRTASAAVLSLTCATYILLPFYPNCEVSPVVLRLVSACILWCIFFVNSVSVPISRKIQVLFTAAKLLGLAVIIVSGIIQLAKGETSNFANAFDTSEFDFKKFPLAIYSGLFAYSGWQYLTQLTEEIVNPSRTVPLSIIISMTIITVVYLLTNVAYFTVLSESEMLTSSAVALDFGQRVLGTWWWTMSVAVAMSTYGSLNGGVFGFARYLLVASREGHMPAIASMIHIDRKTPLPAAALLAPLCLLMLISDDVGSLINYLSFTRWLFIGLTCAIIPYYRWKYPELHRPFKVPLVVPIVFVLCAFFVVGMSLYSSPVDCGIGLGIMLAGIPVYYLCVWWKNKPDWINNKLDRATIFLQQILFVVPPEEGED